MQRTGLSLLCLMLFASSALAQDAAALRKLDPRVLEESQGGMLSRDIRRRLSEANQRQSAAWREIKSKEEWLRYAQSRIQSLKTRLGIQELPGTPPEFLVTKRIEGDGYELHNVVFQSRPGIAVTANLYRPREPKRPMPAILIVHSHHAPKTEGELQDMGMLWARQGAIVLVMDLPGHGERRQHEFIDQTSYPRSFRVGRQDYYFRYNNGLQLPLVGSSLMAWMVHDLRRGIDLVTSLPGVDKSRIALLGAVAGGGDPCAVTAAVDERITAAAPFNFGGPQPESTFPLPDDAESTFNYAGGGSWESTRNLQFSAADGFLPWVIVGSIAPRGLIYGHEFSWDQPHDPVWKRLETIFGFHNQREHLSFATGRGRLSGRPSEASHCNNIGPIQRERIHLALADWFGIPKPDESFHDRRPAAELHAMTAEARQKFSPQFIHKAVALELKQRDADNRADNRVRSPATVAEFASERWRSVLGDAAGVIPREVKREGDPDHARVDRVVLETEPGILVPLLLLRPDPKQAPRPPVVIGLAQAGKQGFLEHRAETIARLLAGGVAVCLPDLRGMGETRPGNDRGRSSSATSLSASAWMLGKSMLGWRLGDLRSVCRWLETRDDLDATRLALWGESFAAANDTERNFAVPLDADDLPKQSEPGGASLALLGGLFEKNVRGVYGGGGLKSYRSLLDSPYLYVPHDAIVPFALANPSADFDAIAAAIAPRPLKLEAQVDGWNRLAGPPASDPLALAQWLIHATR